MTAQNAASARTQTPALPPALAAGSAGEVGPATRLTAGPADQEKARP